MLSLSTEYAGQSTSKNIVSDWLLELSYEDAVSGDGTFYFSGSDRTLTNFYHGNVVSWGAIDESIDLKSSQSSISDVQIELANSWANDSGLLSYELFGGNQKFINQDVVIKSWIPGCALSECLTLYKGRLVDIKHNHSVVTLSIEKRSPWARLKMGGAVSTNNRIRFPLAYGDYTRNASTVSSKDFVPGKDLFPVPVNEVSGEGIISLLPATVGTPSNANTHYYEPSLDIFVPLDPVNTTVKTSYQAGYGIAGNVSLKRGFDFRPTTINSDDPAEFTDPEKAINGNTADYAIRSISLTGPLIAQYDLMIDVPSIKGNITDIDISIKYEIELGAGSDASAEVGIWDASYGGSAPELEIISTLTTPGTTATGAETIHSVAGYTTVNWFNSDRFSANNTLPETIKLQAAILVGGGDNIVASCKIYDVFIRVASELDFTTEETAGTDKVNNLERLYTGMDGFGQKFTGGTGGAYFPHDIYRDMLDRFGGWDATGLNYVEVNGVDWASSDIDTDRDWSCRWWELEQLDLRKTLEQVQFEGGFIWVFDEAASGREARVIYVKSSYSAADIVSPYGMSLDYNDISNVDISMTPFSEIVTTRKFNYQRHPADEKRYLGQNQKVNGNISYYNLGSLENIIEQDLDFITDTGDVDELLTYYDNISGEPKALVKCDILNPAKWALQVGDIAQFTGMAYEPYGKTWSSIYFMCVRTNITPNKFTATFREVG